jgi:hypothetical protein
MPTIDDALELVTDPTYRVRIGPTTHDPVEMRAGAIVARLVQLGAEDEVAARILVTKAAQRVGGQTGLSHRQRGLRSGRGPDLPAEFWLRVPAAALRG